MKILFFLFLSFINIGLLGFGGGYSIVALIQSGLEKNKWITGKEFLDILAISQVTPGSISINTATYVGYKVDGFFGSLVATIAVCLPSFLILMALTPLFFKHKSNSILKSILTGVRPAVTGLVVAAFVHLSLQTIVPDFNLVDIKKSFDYVEWVSLIPFLIFLLIKFVARTKIKAAHILIIGVSSGVLFYFCKIMGIGVL